MVIPVRSLMQVLTHFATYFLLYVYFPDIEIMFVGVIFYISFKPFFPYNCAIVKAIEVVENIRCVHPFDMYLHILVITVICAQE